jgi:hypothetical protein
MLPEFDFQEKKFGMVGQVSNIFWHLHAKPIT